MLANNLFVKNNIWINDKSSKTVIQFIINLILKDFIYVTKTHFSEDRR